MYRGGSGKNLKIKNLPLIRPVVLIPRPEGRNQVEFNASRPCIQPPFYHLKSAGTIKIGR